jgi:hypothetical protein
MKRLKPAETKAERLARTTAAGEPAFVKGGVKPEGSGRKKGQQNRHTVVLKECIQQAMELVGSNNKGKDGATGYLAHLAWRHPDIFGKLLEKMLPYSLSGAGGGPVQVEYTNREEIVLRMKERGLPTPPNLLAAPKRKSPALAEIEDGEFDEVED